MAPKATWPDQVPLGQSFSVRVPMMTWGFGSELMEGDGGALEAILVAVLFDGFAVLQLFHLCKLIPRWRRHRQQTRPQSQSLADSDLSMNP